MCSPLQLIINAVCSAASVFHTELRSICDGSMVSFKNKVIKRPSYTFAGIDNR